MEEKRKELGILLKNFREEKEKTIEEISKDIFIDKYIILCIEKGEKNKKDNTYNRLIIKKYYTYLNGEFKNIVELLDLAYPSDISETIDLTKTISFELIEKNKKKKKKTNRTTSQKLKNISLWIIVFIFLAVLIILTTINIKSSVENQAKTKNETTLVANTKLEPEKTIEEKNDFKIGTFINPLTNLETINITTALTKPFELKFVASGEVYVDSSQNGVILEQKTLNKGEEKTFKISDTQKTIINVGNINACDIYINNQKIQKKKYEDGHQYIMFDQKEE